MCCFHYEITALDKRQKLNRPLILRADWNWYSSNRISFMDSWMDEKLKYGTLITILLSVHLDNRRIQSMMWMRFESSNIVCVVFYRHCPHSIQWVHGEDTRACERRVEQERVFKWSKSQSFIPLHLHSSATDTMSLKHAWSTMQSV